MHLKHVILIILLYSGTTSSKEIHVKYDLKSYQLSLDAKKISIKTNLLNISLARKKCNEILYDRFISNLKTKLSTLNDGISIDSGHVLVKSNGKKKYIQKGNKLEDYFISMPREFKRVKFEDHFLCKKDSNY